MKKTLAVAKSMFPGDWMTEDYTTRARRTPDLPLLGLIIGGSISVALWTGISLTAWTLFLR